MGKKYTFSRSIVNDLGQKEVFTANEFDSFEEARNAVNKGIRDRLSEIVPSPGFRNISGEGRTSGDVITNVNKPNKS